MAPLAANPSNPPPSELQAAALRCLESGGAVVTGNARAARSLREFHAAAQRASGRLAWPTPLIHDWESWLSILWQQRLQSVPDALLLLTPLQEHAVWKKIAISAASDSDAIAKLALNTWELLSDFNAHGERKQPWGAPEASDPEVFRGWASAFDRQCKANHWLSRSGLPALLTESVRQGVVELPRQIILIGFDRLTPAQRSLLDAARAKGSAVGEPEPPPRASSLQLVQAKDLRDELTTCAWWLRRKLEENPSASIAVVVQASQEMRGEVRRIFQGILMPGSEGIESNDAMPFEFSLGDPLATVPLVKAALLALRWLAEPLDQPAISWLATSGFFAAAGEDLLEMAEFDAELRRRSKLPPEASLDEFLHHSQGAASRAGHHFLRRLRGLQREASVEGVSNRRRTFPEWIAVAEALLRQLQWPGGRTLESVEYQARKRWEHALGEVAALGFDGARAGWPEFVTVLDRYASETIFAPESRGAPIQIMGPLESAGQEFDALWFLGADAGSWPAPGQPNPLLPAWLQRKAGMPRASVSGEWALHLAITRRLAASGAESVFSHSLRDETGELRTSALLKEAIGEAAGGALPVCSSEQLRAALQVPALPRHRRRTMRIEDASPIPWPVEISAGGASILTSQSACAFQSFAVRRLGAEELDTPERGLTPLDRGNVAHDAMNAFWSKPNPANVSLKTRRDLIYAKENGLLPAVLDFHIAEALRQRRAADQSDEWSQAYFQVEHDRLRSLLLKWLDYETTRTDFTVEACERDSEADINGLQLRLRVDRIDYVEGGRLILDYKTGKVAPSMWAGERPDDPQLPLYAIHGGVEDLRGVLFAQLRPGEMMLKGRVEDANKTVSTDFDGRSDMIRNPLTPELREEWSAALSNLVGQFIAGNAAVEPKFYPNTCRYCPLPALCRVAETTVPIEAAADAVVEGDDDIEEDATDE